MRRLTEPQGDPSFFVAMQQARRTLSLKPAPQESLEPADVIRRAIIRRTCVVATYNKAQIKLAPHIFYTRHDDPFVDGQVVERDGKPPREAKLGVFKLAGLSDIRSSTTPFNPLPAFDANDALYQDVTVLAVQN